MSYRPGTLRRQIRGATIRLTGALSLWLAAGYVEWLLSIVAGQRGVIRLLPTAVFLATLLCAGLLKSLWKPVAAIGLLVGAGVLVWSLAANGHGLWVHNSHFAQEPLQYDWMIVQGILVSAGPGVVIGWRIGRIEPCSRRIWLSGFAGLWLPMVVSVTMASLANQAGMNLYWVPSLFRGFLWALGGLQGHIEQGAVTLTIWTLLLPGLVGMISLRQLVPPWSPRRNFWLIPLGVGLFAFAVASISFDVQVHSFFSTTFHQIWAYSLVILGAAAVLRCAVRLP